MANLASTFRKEFCSMRPILRRRSDIRNNPYGKLKSHAEHFFLFNIGTLYAMQKEQQSDTHTLIHRGGESNEGSK